MPRASLLAVAAGALVFAAAAGTAAGRWLDEAVFAGLLRLGRTRAEPVLEVLVHLADVAPYAVATATLVGIALVRGRPRSAVAVAVVLAGSAVTTQLLKPLLAAERTTEQLATQLPSASWPSGHTTAAVAVALCAVMVAPARLRPVVAAAGGTLAAGVGLATVALAWHYPSDVLGGVAVASAWAFALARPGRGSLAAPAPSLVVVLAGLAALAVAVAARPAAALSFAQQYTAAAVLAPVVALTALGATAAMATAIARPEPGRRGRSCGDGQAVRDAPGCHSGSSPPLAPRERMKSRSESRLR